MIDEIDHIDASEKNNYIFVPSSIFDENHRKEIQNLIDKEEQKDDKNKTLIDTCLHQLGGKIWHTDGKRYFTVRVNNKYEIKALPQEQQDYFFENLIKEVEKLDFPYSYIFMFSEHTERQDLINLAIRISQNKNIDCLLKPMSFNEFKLESSTIDLFKKINKSDNFTEEQKEKILLSFSKHDEIVEIFSPYLKTIYNKLYKSLTDNSLLKKIHIHTSNDHYIKHMIDSVGKDEINKAIIQFVEHYSQLGSINIKTWLKIFEEAGKLVCVSNSDLKHVKPTMDIHLFYNKKELEIDTKVRVEHAIEISLKYGNKIIIDTKFKNILENMFRHNKIDSELYNFVIGKQQVKKTKFAL
jgi:hypothetical protein